MDALLRYWTADPELAASLGDTANLLQPRAHPYSAACIQQKLCFLRVFAPWIGKPGLVRDAERCTTQPELVRGSYGRSTTSDGAVTALMSRRQSMRWRRLIRTSRPNCAWPW